MYFRLSVVPIVLSSSHVPAAAAAAAASKSTRLIQDGGRYIFLVEDTRNTKASSAPQGTSAPAAKGAEEATEEGGNQEEGEDETGEMRHFTFGQGPNPDHSLRSRAH